MGGTPIAISFHMFGLPFGCEVKLVSTITLSFFFCLPCALNIVLYIHGEKNPLALELSQGHDMFSIWQYICTVGYKIER